MTAEDKITRASMVAHTQGIATAQLHGEVMALNIELGTCYGLNGTGSRIWSLLTGQARVADVCARLVAEYEVDAETCESQVLEILEELRTGGLVEITSPVTVQDSE